MPSARTLLTTGACIGAAALGGAVLANAATNGNDSNSSSADSTTTSRPAPPPRDPSKGGHEFNGKTEKLLTGDTADKVEAAAKAKVPGGTIERVENDVDTGSPYEAHVRKADGSEVVVYVNSDFKVTSVDTMGGHGGHGGPGFPGGPDGPDGARQ